jgi:DNA-binding transcriptional ArsR family regulator
VEVPEDIVERVRTLCLAPISVTPEATATGLNVDITNGPGAIVWTVHLLPAERSGHRIIDGERVCQAIAAISPPEAMQAQAKTFAVLGDPTRLTLLIAIKAAGPISVSDLAAATGLNDTTVSQTLRFLRAAEVVSTERDGRVIRYQLADGPVAALLP